MNKKIILLAIFVVGLFAVLAITAPKAEACDNCSQASWSQLCAQKLQRSGYGGNLAYTCAPINSGAALRCMAGLADRRYSLNRDLANGCTWTTSCGMEVLNGVFRRGWQVTGESVKYLGSADSDVQTECFKQVLFSGRYSNVTIYNLRTICPN